MVLYRTVFVDMRLASVCGEETPNHRARFRWILEFKGGKDRITKGKSSGRLAIARKLETIQYMSNMIMANRLHIRRYTIFTLVDLGYTVLLYFPYSQDLIFRPAYV